MPDKIIKMTTKKLPALVWIAFITLCIVWGTTYLGIKNAVKYFPPFWFSGFRHVAAGLIFLLFCFFKGYSLPSLRDIARLAIVGGCMIICGNALLSWAEIYISSGLAGILSSIAPLFTTLLSIVFFKGFRITGAIVGGLVLSIVGMALLSKPDEAFQVSDGFILGIILTCIANFGWALGSVFMKKFEVNAHVFMRTGIQMVTAGSFNLVIGTFFEPKINFSAVPTEGWLWVAYLIIIGSLVGYTCFVYLLEYMSPARLSIHVYVNTVVAVLVGWLFANEHLTWLMFGAMLIVLMGVVVVNNAYAKMAQIAFKKS
jgi:drug/metabolite transporter (DMT)-like permease